MKNKTSKNGQGLKVDYISPSKLIPYVNNARTHSEQQVKQVAASIKEFGFTNPVLIDEENGIIAGHGRVMAATLMGLDQVPTITLTGLSEAQRKAYILADNKLALNADWDIELLMLEIDMLDADDFDISLIGFDEDELGNMRPDVLNEGLTDEDAVPDMPDEPTTVLGDVWTLGNHRLMCGDSTSIDAVETLMDGQKSDLVFTDPPYGMSYGGGRAAGSSKKGDLVKAHGKIIGDDLQGDDLMQMVSDSIGNASNSSKEGSAAYVCFTWRTYSEFENALKNIGMDIKACVVWDKKSIGLGNSNYRPQHEFIFYCGGQWYGDKSQPDLWHMSRGATGQYVHPTQKPVELIEKAIVNSSKAGDTVHDCFGGSGSTMIACEKTGRYSRMMELDPKYCDVIIKRWQEFTGQDAVHENGKTFNEVNI